MKQLLRSLVAFALVGVSPALADVKLPAVFSDHLVLQQDVPAAVWGWADAGEDVTVSFGKQTKSTKAGADGKWAIKLDASPAAAAGTTLTVKGKNTLTVNDVLVGEVWLCSGQSNMAFTVGRGDDADKEAAAANYPQIRMFTVGRNPQRTPQPDCKGTWEVCSPATVKNFSGAGYFFGRAIHLQLKRPVGLINSSYGGTDIAAWTSEEVQLPIPELKAQLDTWMKNDKAWDEAKATATYEKQLAAFKEAQKKAKADKTAAPRAPQKPVRPSLNQNCPANLFNGMIAPIVPYTIRGAIWYQGENNTRTEENSVLYQKQLPLMIRDWRTRWGDEFPFAWVQLPNFIRKGEAWPLMRESMLKSLSVPKTGMAITIDIGTPANIHPTNKQDVGKRLSMWALATVYDVTGVASSGPLPAGHEIRGGEIVVTFKHADGGLVAKGGELKGFVVAGADGVWHPAVAKIDGEKVVVSCPEVPKPAALRYAWADNPTCNLYNGAGIPASPFRTDGK